MASKSAGKKSAATRAAGTRKAGKASGGGNRGGSKGGASVSLAAEDRRYLTETLTAARDKVGELAAGVNAAAIFEALEGFGLTSERVERLKTAISDLPVKESVDKASEYLGEQIESAREYARENPKTVIGGAAGVLVGASLLAIALRRAAAEREKERQQKARAGRKGGRATARKSSSGSRKSSGGGSKKGSKKR